MTTHATLTRRLARYRAARETPMSASKRRQLDALIRATERRLETTITPEAIEADERLTEEQKAQAYDYLFEYHGEGES